VRASDGAASTPPSGDPTLIVLSLFEPDAFDHSMDVAQSDDDNPGVTGEAEPVCAVCGSNIGIFMERDLAWRHCTGDGTTVGQQHVYDPGHRGFRLGGRRVPYSRRLRPGCCAWRFS
jgi:hypothetical protein